MRNEWFIHELYYIKTLFRLNQKWNRKKLIIGPKISQKAVMPYFLNARKSFNPIELNLSPRNSKIL